MWNQRFLQILVILILTYFPILAQFNELESIQNIEQYRIDGNIVEATRVLNKLAFYYWEKGNLEKSMESFEQSVALNKDIGNENAIKGIYSNMGMISSDLGQPEKALVFFRKSMMLSKKLNHKQAIGTNLLNIALSLETLGRDEEALDNLERALSIILETNNLKLLRSCYGNLADVHEKLGNSEKSMEYFGLYASFQKKIQKEEVEKEKLVSKIKIAESEKKAKKAIQEKVITEQKLEVTKDSLKVAEEINFHNQILLQLQQAQLKSQRLLTFIFIAGTFLLAIIAIIILRSYRQKQKHNIVLENRNEEIRKQNDEIKNKNKKINQSINYAQNIQGALLPEIESFSDLFKDSFIFFKPRDVVSGDFYWFASADQNNKLPKGIKIVAAVDCTGHGVPGAFMSMLGMSFLEDIVIDKQILEPVAILEEMHKMVRSSLKQEQSGNTDGMDMALCVYDENKKVINFAGAVNPLIYIQNHEFLVGKAEIFGIGSQMKGDGREFTQKTIDVSKPTTCYIYSDGFADQFGGEKGRKYFTRNFKKLLFDIHTKPMDEQHRILDETLINWHGDEYSRVDDVLVIGFKVG